MVKSDLEAWLLRDIRAVGLPEPETEFRFHKTRKWRFDICWPDLKIAVEINGAIYTRGRHARGLGLEKDYEKINEAQLLSWRVFQFSGGQIESGYAIATIERAFGYGKTEE